ncbi:MAG: class II fructose-bisphosphate aldolase [Candidatus Altiarchaeota archaeon]|nr:class II fructose-bisphosphate aldolase [Candidatus Altiarchaeota archaeon]
MTDFNKPVSGKHIFNALKDRKCIIMAANIRIQRSARGIMEAAKELDSALLFEIAKSEVEYTGQTPKDFYDNIVSIAEEIDFNTPYAIHGDHITIKDTSPEAYKGAEDLIKAETAAGFTSYAIDASHNFNMSATDVGEQLKDNLEITKKLAKLIPEKYSLEVEVGEVGRTDPTTGEKQLTTVEEAATFIKALKAAGINPDLLATNNGTSHGNIYDKNGNVVAKVGIDLARTKAIADAIKPYGVRVAQHGITGTPLEFMGNLIDCGIAKGNVGTNWQNISIENFPPELVKRMEEWSLTSDEAKKTKAKKPQITDKELIGKTIKNSIKVFKKDIDSIPDEYRRKLDSSCRKSAADFIKAFQSQGTGSIVKKYMEKL